MGATFSMAECGWRIEKTVRRGIRTAQPILATCPRRKKLRLTAKSHRVHHFGYDLSQVRDGSYVGDRSIAGMAMVGESQIWFVPGIVITEDEWLAGGLIVIGVRESNRVGRQVDEFTHVQF